MNILRRFQTLFWRHASTSRVAVDREWYLRTYPDVAAARMDPFYHYHRYGIHEGRLPRPSATAELELDLWLGNIDNAAKKLTSIAEHSEEPEASYARRVLMAWYGAHGDWRRAFELVEDDGPHCLQVGRPPAYNADLVAIVAAIETGHIELARCWLADVPEPSALDFQLMEARLGAPDGVRPSAVLNALNRRWLEADLRRIDLTENASSPFESLEAPLGSRVSGELVTVIVPVYNSASMLPTALRSLLEQTWKTLEVIVVNDGSGDDTSSVLESWRPKFERFDVVNLDENVGPYVARNVALQRAKGHFITVHDADDWSHPQKIELQVRALQQSSAVASVSSWLRMTEDLVPYRFGVESGYVHRNVSSLMFRREAFDQLGYWDRVRFGGDTEFYYRTLKAFGDQSIIEVAPTIPLAFGRTHPNSLTQAPPSHMATRRDGVRGEYEAAATRWHAEARSLYLPFKPETRPFPIPPTIGVNDPPPLAMSDVDTVRSSEFFDASSYRRRYADVRHQRKDPAEHYCEVGAREGRQPAPWFDVAAYSRVHGLKRENPVLHLERLQGEAGAPYPPRLAGSQPSTANHVMVFGHLAGEQLFGAERSLLDVIDRLREEFSVSVVLPEYRNDWYVQQVLARCSELFFVPLRWRRKDVSQPAAVIDHLRRLLRTVSPSEVHVNTITLDAPLIAAEAEGISRVVHVRELPHNDAQLCETLGYAPSELRDVVIAQADRLIANSTAVGEWLNCSQKVSIVPNAVDRRLLEMPFEPQERLRVGMISSNILKKGIEDFCEVARLTKSTSSAIDFVLVGPISDDLKALKEVPDNVEIVGYVDHPADAVGKMDIVLNLSKFSESFGRTIIEGMAAGRPAVCYNRGTPARLVEDGVNGRVVEADDPNQVAEAILELNADRRRLNLMSQNCRVAAQRFVEGRATS